mmetsp:Transcript_41504/g.124024  ORF Transcript_41504/g.124024 Transcript_41504/m.124024 type:complete len:84 (+) Transcript_41504:649-900(+)
MRASANLVGPQLDVGLHNSILKLAANKTLGVEDRVRGVHGNLVLGSVTNQALSVRECDVGRRGTVALIVGDDLHAVVLPDAHA